jgi:hypothetical protein
MSISENQAGEAESQLIEMYKNIPTLYFICITSLVPFRGKELASEKIVSDCITYLESSKNTSTSVESKNTSSS